MSRYSRDGWTHSRRNALCNTRSYISREQHKA